MLPHPKRCHVPRGPCCTTNTQVVVFLRITTCLSPNLGHIILYPRVKEHNTLQCSSAQASKVENPGDYSSTYHTNESQGENYHTVDSKIETKYPLHHHERNRHKHPNTIINYGRNSTNSGRHLITSSTSGLIAPTIVTILALLLLKFGGGELGSAEEVKIKGAAVKVTGTVD